MGIKNNQDNLYGEGISDIEKIQIDKENRELNKRLNQIVNEEDDK